MPQTGHVSSTRARAILPYGGTSAASQIVRHSVMADTVPLTEAPSAHSHRQPAAAPPRAPPAPDKRSTNSSGSDVGGAQVTRRLARRRAIAVDNSHVISRGVDERRACPSVRATIVPRWSVRNTCAPCADESLHDRRRRKMIAVSRADRDQRESRAHCVEKRFAAARLAAVMTDLENIRMQARSLRAPAAIPLLDARRRPSSACARHRTATKRHDAREIGIVQRSPSTPSRARESVSDTPSTVECCRRDGRALQRTCSARAASSEARYAVGAAGKPSVDERRADAGRAAHSPRRRRDRCADATARTRRAHRRVARCTESLSMRPASPPRQLRPASNSTQCAVRRAQRDRIALPDVDHVQLDIVRIASGRAAAMTAPPPRRSRSPLAGCHSRDAHATIIATRQHAGDRPRRRSSAPPQSTPRASRRRMKRDAVRVATSSGCAASANKAATGRIGDNEQSAEHHRLRERDQRVRREIRERRDETHASEHPGNDRRRHDRRDSRAEQRDRDDRAEPVATDRTPTRLPSRAGDDH